MTEQTEVITWHKYPEDKPEKSGMYLVITQIASYGNICPNEMMKAFWSVVDSGGQWLIDVGIIVIAFAELPKGWQEE